MSVDFTKKSAAKLTRFAGNRERRNYFLFHKQSVKHIFSAAATLRPTGGMTIVILQGREMKLREVQQMKTMRMKLLATAIAMMLIIGLVSSASALLIDANYRGGFPNNPYYSFSEASYTPYPAGNWWKGDSPNNPAAKDMPTITGETGPFTELYKQNVGEAGDTGLFASFYKTTFDFTPEDPSYALIKYLGGLSSPITSPLYLLVKDGNNNPTWFVFGLNLPGGPAWDGMSDISLLNFWPNQGGISHVALYGSPVPEPGTMILLGMGLLGVGLAMRKRS